MATMWSFWTVTEVEKLALEFVMHTAGLAQEKRDPAVATKALATLEKPLKILDAALAAGAGNLVGGRFTIADLNVCAIVMWLRAAPTEFHANFPHIGAWILKARERPARQKDGRSALDAVPATRRTIGGRERRLGRSRHHPAGGRSFCQRSDDAHLRRLAAATRQRIPRHARRRRHRGDRLFPDLRPAAAGLRHCGRPVRQVSPHPRLLRDVARHDGGLRNGEFAQLACLRAAGGGLRGRRHRNRWRSRGSAIPSPMTCARRRSRVS